MFCVKGLCSLHFHHVEEVFKSSWHLLLTCLVNWPSDIRGEIVSHWLINVMSFILDVKWFTKIKVGPPYLLCSMCEASHRVGKWFAPNAVPVVWREPKDHLFDCDCCWTDVKQITSNSRLSVKYPHLPSAVRPVRHSEELPLPKPL